MVAKPLCPLYKKIIKPLDKAHYPALRYYNGKYTLFSKMGRYTLSFYLFHAMMLRPFRNDLIVDIFHDTWFYQYFSGSEVLRWCGVFIIFIMMTLISWVLICVCKKWKWTRLFCLGQKSNY